jgi:hypothetical protein
MFRLVRRDRSNEGEREMWEERRNEERKMEVNTEQIEEGGRIKERQRNS